MADERPDIIPIGKKNPNLPFHPAVRAGDFIFVSGQVAKDENGNMCVGNIEDECRWTIESIARVLAAADAGLNDVVKVTVYLGGRAQFRPIQQGIRGVLSRGAGVPHHGRSPRCNRMQDRDGRGGLQAAGVMRTEHVEANEETLNMVRLLGRKTSGNVQKVLWLLEELGLDYTREDYGRQFGNTADPAYLDLNPTGKVPTLVDGDIVVWESNTILRYLCGHTGSDFHPNDPTLRCKAEVWMDWQLASLNGPYLDVFRESKKAEDERSPDLQQKGDALAAQLALLDAHLADREWLGEAMSVAEFALGPIVHRCLNFPIDLPDLDNLSGWHARISGREAFQKVVAA